VTTARSQVTALALLLAIGGRSTAQPDPRSLYERGIKHYQVGEFEEAIADFKAAYEIEPTPGLLFNLAQAHRQLGDNHRAAFFYRQFVAQSPPSKARTDAEAIILELEGPPKPPPAAAMTPIATTQAPPARHEWPTHGQAVALVASTAAIGGALVFTGVGLSVHAKDEYDTLQHVPQGMPWTQQYASHYDAAHASSEAATAMYVLGGVSIAASVVSAVVLRHALHRDMGQGALSWSF